VGLLVKSTGKPDAGNPHVRFDEGEGFPSLLYWIKMADLEKHLEGHDEQIHAIFEAVRQLMQTDRKPRKRIGFTLKEKQARVMVSRRSDNR
jgi:hypothetical protein